MEGITEIDKTKYIDECKEIVRNEILEELSDEMLTIVTNEIMDTCLFIGGDFNELITSIKTKLMVLDNDIKVYPGHMDSSNIGYERLRNPFLQDEFEIF